MSQRSGQGFSLSVIVIAAIALVVMVIIIALVINSSGNVNRNVGSCEVIEGAQCVPQFDYEQNGCPDGLIRNPTRGCGQESPQICCIPLGN